MADRVIVMRSGEIIEHYVNDTSVSVKSREGISRHCLIRQPVDSIESEITE